ncbi:uncharacterized protein LACBIDRAFT_334912 [Laccaria bicolor S238N-H82]|uniref:Predicted protein n=1 Tax=Laccaria bicolor (strain S238N-H82 / ATCC MYA-4686) TaxID=486041 RepID=B0E0R4_LACBS|nr:uncharacterized protein LACBIDRAFT_334912 [Laccaria bicolor S238N-H82]EDQ99548.1 predicted protein [Laccaria bicolor S238N-H82]|eukprot:XP_001889772.1 predicted protein [Laccaria bicolor S238N-H82]
MYTVMFILCALGVLLPVAAKSLVSLMGNHDERYTSTSHIDVGSSAPADVGQHSRKYDVDALEERPDCHVIKLMKRNPLACHREIGGKEQHVSTQSELEVSKVSMQSMGGLEIQWASKPPSTAPAGALKPTMAIKNESIYHLLVSIVTTTGDGKFAPLGLAAV